MPQPTELPSAVALLEARRKVLDAMAGLSRETSRILLKDLLQDFLDEEAGGTASGTPQKVARPSNVPPRSPAARPLAPPPRVLAPPPEKSLAERIVDYCRQHPTPDGTYSVQEIARLVLPPGSNPAMVHTAITRNSPQSDRTPKPAHPRFFRLGAGTFKLYDPADEKGTGT